MDGRFDLSEGTISQAVENHKRARRQRAKLEGEQGGWSLLCYPVLIFIRWREQRALSRLIAVVPSTAEDARCKLLHLMAAMIVDRAPSQSDDIETVVDTLRPHQISLTSCLRK